MDEGIELWSNINLAESDAITISYPNLKSSSRPVSIRLPISLIDGIKERANFFGVPYQVLMKLKLSEIIDDKPKPNPS